MKVLITLGIFTLGIVFFAILASNLPLDTDEIKPTMKALIKAGSFEYDGGIYTVTKTLEKQWVEVGE